MSWMMRPQSGRTVCLRPVGDKQGLGPCGQCASGDEKEPVAISYCVDCDTSLCSDCVMVDEERDEHLCEACKTDRENQGE